MNSQDSLRRRYSPVRRRDTMPRNDEAEFSYSEVIRTTTDFETNKAHRVFPSYKPYILRIALTILCIALLFTVLKISFVQDNNQRTLIDMSFPNNDGHLLPLPPADQRPKLIFYVPSFPPAHKIKDCGGCRVWLELRSILEKMGFPVLTTKIHSCPSEEEVANVTNAFGSNHVVFLHNMRSLGCSNQFPFVTHVYWILAPLESILPRNHTNHWGIDDLVFTYAPGYIPHAPLSNSLMVLTDLLDGDETDLPDNLFYNKERSGILWTMRKGESFHDNITYIHEHPGLNATVMERDHPKNLTMYEYFVSYDPYTHWNWLAAMSGAVSVVYPMSGKSKYDWLSTYFGSYLHHIGERDMPGIAYGWVDSELAYARRTMRQLRPFMVDIKKWGEEITVPRFVRDCYRHASGMRSGFEGGMLVRDAYPMVES